MYPYEKSERETPSSSYSTHGIGVLSDRNGVPESSSRKRARSNAASVLRPHAASSPMWCGSSAISSVGAAAQRRLCTAGPAASVA